MGAQPTAIAGQTPSCVTASVGSVAPRCALLVWIASSPRVRRMPQRLCTALSALAEASHAPAAADCFRALLGRTYRRRQFKIVDVDKECRYAVAMRTGCDGNLVAEISRPLLSRSRASWLSRRTSLLVCGEDDAARLRCGCTVLVPAVDQRDLRRFAGRCRLLLIGIPPASLKLSSSHLHLAQSPRGK